MSRGFVHAEGKFLRTMLTMARYGDLVRDAREAAGLSKAELADRVGLSPSMISKIESGKVHITPPVFRKLTSELRALRPADLATAIGYEVTTIGADRLPRGLVQDLLTLPPEELDALALIVQRRARPGRPVEGVDK